MDQDAAKLNRNLREDPNSLAFSIRTEYCSGDPFIFGPSGTLCMGLVVWLICLFVIAHVDNAQGSTDLHTTCVVMVSAGSAVYYTLIPIYAIIRFILYQYTVTILRTEHENTFREELREIVDTFQNMFRTVKSMATKKRN